MMIRGAASAAALVAVAVLASGCAGSGAAQQPTKPAAASSPSATPSAAGHSPALGLGVLGKFRTAQRWLSFTEPAHTGPTGDQLGPRTLRVQIWYPLARAAGLAGRPAAGPLPLIAFGPGFMQCGKPYSRLLRAWASAGYVVEVVNFPLSDCLAGAPTEADMVNQPADMSYAITRLLDLRTASRGPLRALRLSRHEIGVAGQSDGGDTVAAVAASACCADHRVAAVAVLSGARWPAFPGAYYATQPAPMLFTQGSADTVNLPGCSVALYHADPSRARYYLDLYGADHTTPYWGSNRFERVVARVSVVFFDRYVLGLGTAGHSMRPLGDVPGTSALFSRGGGHLPPGPCVT
jgi:predicted dienelactone hydrolase